MAPLPVIPNVFRIQFDWSSSGPIVPSNTLHVLGTGLTTADLFTEFNTAIGPNGAAMFDMMSSAVSCFQVTITKLDGVEASRQFTLGAAITGGEGGEIIPAAAMVVSLRTAQRGPRGRGRVFIGPCSEAALSGGLFNPLNVTQVTDAWADFRDALFSASPVTGLCVASYVHSDAHLVESINVDRVHGVLRSRQQQLR